VYYQHYFSTNPKHTTMQATMKKFNSVPTKASTTP